MVTPDVIMSVIIFVMFGISEYVVQRQIQQYIHKQNLGVSYTLLGRFSVAATGRNSSYGR